MYQHYVASSVLEEISARIDDRQSRTGFLNDAPRRPATSDPAMRRPPASSVLPPHINGAISLTRGRTFHYTDPRLALASAASLSRPAPSLGGRQRSAMYREYRERSFHREEDIATPRPNTPGGGYSPYSGARERDIRA